MDESLGILVLSGLVGLLVTFASYRFVMQRRQLSSGRTIGRYFPVIQDGEFIFENRIPITTGGKWCRLSLTLQGVQASRIQSSARNFFEKTAMLTGTPYVLTIADVQGRVVHTEEGPLEPFVTLLGGRSQSTETMLGERTAGSSRGTFTLLEFLPKEAGEYFFYAPDYREGGGGVPGLLCFMAGEGGDTYCGGRGDSFVNNRKVSAQSHPYIENGTMDQSELTPCFYDIFDASLPRLGPGDDFSTQKAIGLLCAAKPRLMNPPDSSRLRVLDLGCGNGAQTIQLAKHLEGAVTAVDNHEPYLIELRRRAVAEGVSDKVRTCLSDMRDYTTKAKGVYDLIWSEGALYSMGFREGLAACRHLLAPGGLMAVSELIWFTTNPPVECREFFEAEYPPMVDNAANLAIIEKCGYEVLEHFALPESSWLESFYCPIEDRLRLLQGKYAADSAGNEVIESIWKEIDIYRRYSDWYGYIFYLMQSR